MMDQQNKDKVYNFFVNKYKYDFKDKDLMMSSVIHSSYDSSYGFERLEFLGDAVLELVISDVLFNTNPDSSEGELTKKRSSMVCGSSLSDIAISLGINEILILGKGEILNNGKYKKSILENTFEAIAGAIFLDSDYTTAKKVLSDIMYNYLSLEEKKDYKSILQEYMQSKDKKHKIEYIVNDVTGPSHKPFFTIDLYIDDDLVSSGCGGSKKSAEQNAAKTALEFINKREIY